MIPICIAILVVFSTICLCRKMWNNSKKDNSKKKTKKNASKKK